MQTLPSGIKKWESNDFVKMQHYNDNWQTINDQLQRMIEEVDTTTYDAAEKIYTTVTYKRPADNTAYLKAVLSGKDVNGNYLTDTWTLYAADGITVADTIVWTYQYDAYKNIVKKTPNK